VIAGVDDRLGLGVLSEALPTAGVRPVDPSSSTESEKRSLFCCLFSEGVIVWKWVVLVAGLAGEMAELLRFERRVSILIFGMLSVMKEGDGMMKVKR
jgi:hypothetical protein